MYLPLSKLSEGHVFKRSLDLTRPGRFHRSADLPARGRLGFKLLLELRNSGGSHEWTLCVTVRITFDGYDGRSNLALGCTSLPDTTPTCEEQAGRIIADRVQKLQHVKPMVGALGRKHGFREDLRSTHLFAFLDRSVWLSVASQTSPSPAYT
jgi:hypothetical protein